MLGVLFAVLTLAAAGTYPISGLALKEKQIKNLTATFLFLGGKLDTATLPKEIQHRQLI